MLIKKSLIKLTYRIIYAVNTVNERRETMKKNTNPVKLRDTINNKKLSVISGKAFIGDTVRDYSPDQFTEDLEFLCESGYMAD